MTQTADHPASPWSPREAELLAVTLDLLQEHGYDGLTVDAVANTARASKATVYRRWPSKAELVLAAFTEGVRQIAVLPNTGTLRGDLITLGEVCAEQCLEQAGTIRAVLVELSRHPALSHAFQHDFLNQPKATMDEILRQAVDRGEITADAVQDDSGTSCPGISSSGASFPTARRPAILWKHWSTSSFFRASPDPAGKLAGLRIPQSVRSRLLCSTVQYRTVISIDRSRVIRRVWRVMPDQRKANG